MNDQDRSNETRGATVSAMKSAMCECSHHWYMHAESGYTAPGAVCYGYIGSATPGPLREPCRCPGFTAWNGPRDARTGEPVKPLTLTTGHRPSGSRLWEQAGQEQHRGGAR
jgi:hypothetical protein